MIILLIKTSILLCFFGVITFQFLLTLTTTLRKQKLKEYCQEFGVTCHVYTKEDIYYNG
jgi:hypothetical protein